MNIRNFLLALTLASLSLSGTVQSAPLGKALVYIAPQYYEHEIKLWHFYYDYWFNQGEMVEPIALNALQPLFAGADLCRGGEAADMIVTIKPQMFYNPHMSMFYGDIEAHIYSGSGKPIATYHAETQSSGFLDVKPEAKVQAVYQDTMQKIVSQMQADPALTVLATQGLPEAETKMPCEMVSVLRAK